jgi:hypothetical protein
MSTRAQLPLAVTGVLSAAGPADKTFEALDGFNFSLWGSFIGTVILVRSLGGSPFLPFTYIDGTVLTWSAPMSTTLEDPEAGVRWRVNVTSYTSGAINWRLSR